MVAAAERLGPQLADHARKLGKAFAAEGLDALRVDYTRLFVGPSDVYTRPYAVEWTGQETEVVSIYADAGFEIGKDFRERPDHVAVELEFLYRLVHLAAEEARQRFVAQHLAKWIPPFSAAVQADAQTAFYRELAQLTEQLVAIESAT